MSPFIAYPLIVFVSTGAFVATVQIKAHMSEDTTPAPLSFTAQVRAEILKQYDGVPVADSSVPAAAQTNGQAGAWKVNGKIAQCVASVGATPQDVALACTPPAGK